MTAQDYDQVKLGEMCAMSTTPEDQMKVFALGQSRADKGLNGPKVISSFGEYLGLRLQVAEKQDITHGLLIDIRCSTRLHRKRNIIAPSSSQLEKSRIAQMSLFWTCSCRIYLTPYLLAPCLSHWPKTSINRWKKGALCY